MPTFAEIVTVVFDFIADYAVFIAAGAVVGLALRALRRSIKAGA
jgi:hypothetical protein